MFTSCTVCTGRHQYNLPACAFIQDTGARIVGYRPAPACCITKLPAGRVTTGVGKAAACDVNRPVSHCYSSMLQVLLVHQQRLRGEGITQGNANPKSHNINNCIDRIYRALCFIVSCLSPTLPPRAMCAGQSFIPHSHMHAVRSFSASCSSSQALQAGLPQLPGLDCVAVFSIYLSAHPLAP